MALIRHVDDSGHGQVEFSTYFAYDGDQMTLAFEDPTGTSASSLANRYLYGALVDHILADENALNDERT